jgi:hypothetical protein
MRTTNNPSVAWREAEVLTAAKMTRNTGALAPQKNSIAAINGETR